MTQEVDHITDHVIDQANDQVTDLAIIARALTFATQKHRDQRRKDINASPYINHPIDLINVLINEAGVTDTATIASALLHDTVEDTETTFDELEQHFGKQIAEIVAEVTDDKTLRKEQRKQQQIEHAASASYPARLVKLADKICNLRDMNSAAPAGWNLERRREYFDWSKAVIEQIRGETHERLEELFDQAFLKRP